MTAYNPIANSDVDPESPITTNLMTFLRDNPIAISEGTSPAPKIQTAAYAASSVDAAAIGAGQVGQSEIGANAVGQSELKDATGELTFGVSGNQVLAGGAYGFYPQIRGNSGTATAGEVEIGRIVDPGTTSITNVYVTVTDGTIFVNQRYFTASAPYILDDLEGEIHQFVYAMLDANGGVLAAYAAPEAPWHYNGPTDIRGKMIQTGVNNDDPKKPVKIFERGQIRRDLSGVADSYLAALASGDAGRVRAYLEAFAGAGATFRAVDQDLKNADMGLIPHPFVGKDPAVDRIVILDPVSDLCNQLAEMCQHDRVSICELLHDGYLKFDNTAITNRAGPPGVPIHSLKWKST